MSDATATGTTGDASGNVTGKVTDNQEWQHSVKMFKWKVSGLGGKKDKSKTQQQQTRLNNEPQQVENVVEVKTNNNNKTKDSGKKEK